jgi:hypothetical protein
VGAQYQREVAHSTTGFLSVRGVLLGAYNVNQTQIFANGFWTFNAVKGSGDSPLMNNLLRRFAAQCGRAFRRWYAASMLQPTLIRAAGGFACYAFAGRRR